MDRPVHAGETTWCLRAGFRDVYICSYNLPAIHVGLPASASFCVLAPLRDLESCRGSKMMRSASACAGVPNVVVCHKYY